MPNRNEQRLAGNSIGKRSSIPSADIDWDLVTVWRKNKETWKQISVRLGGGMSPQLLRVRAANLGKIELLGHALGHGPRADWTLITKLIASGKTYNEIAQHVGLSSGHSLYTMVHRRRRQGRWTLPLPPKAKRAAWLKALRERLAAQHPELAPVESDRPSGTTKPILAIAID